MKSSYRNATYSYIFANSYNHADISTWLEFLKLGSWGAALGLFYHGVCVGQGELCFENRKKRYLHTDSVRLLKGFRRKGHGVHLYLALIDAARNLKAKRLYASTNLNKYSTRMWKEKLGKCGVDVRVIKGCKKPCRHCSKKDRYYIEL